MVTTLFVRLPKKKLFIHQKCIDTNQNVYFYLITFLISLAVLPVLGESVELNGRTVVFAGSVGLSVLGFVVTLSFWHLPHSCKHLLTTSLHPVSFRSSAHSKQMKSSITELKNLQ